MSRGARLLAVAWLALSAAIAAAAPAAPAAATAAMAAMGRQVFFDPGLSLRRNQSCASCHAPQTGFSGPGEQFNRDRGGVHAGSVDGRFGNRRPPSAAYAATAPALHRARRDGQWLWIGGHFSDGRATGLRLGDPAAEQAQRPLLDDLEQALPAAACVIRRACDAGYGLMLRRLDRRACDIGPAEPVNSACDAGTAPQLEPRHASRVARSMDLVGRALASFERSVEVSPFDSRFDAWRAGRARLTAQELLGMRLFEGQGKCANCHTLRPGRGGAPPLFTDFSYDNLGVPRNRANPWLNDAARNPDGRGWTDTGLGGFLATQPGWRHLAASQVGKHKVPTVRNVDRRPEPGFVKAYMHNGYFTSLKAVVHFYNTRDTKTRCADPWTSQDEALKADCWPAPEVADNLNRDEMGDLKLTGVQEDALVAFMRTLSDGYRAPGRAVRR